MVINWGVKVRFKLNNCSTLYPSPGKQAGIWSNTVYFDEFSNFYTFHTFSPILIPSH